MPKKKGRNETKIKMNPLSPSKTVVGIPQTSSKPEGAPIAGVHVLGHRDQAYIGGGLEWRKDGE